MKFLQLLDGAEVLFRRGNPEISGVEYDSRRVNQGFAFVAIRGETTDGNRYINTAIANGAVAIVSDSATVPERYDIAWAQVPHGRRALARVSANFYHRPAERLSITGITGTNGKTTTAFLLDSILTAAGRKAALASTIEYHLGSTVIPAPHTTPEALELNQLFAQAVQQGASEAVMEVSSHALEQERVYGTFYDVAVFTNLTQDHLDYHGTLEDYFGAKKKLFEGVGTEPPRVAVLNIDDSYGASLVDFAKSRGSKVLTYGLKQGEFRAENVDLGMNGTRFDLITPERKVPLFSALIGTVNLYNIVAASGAAFARGVPGEAMAAGVRSLTRVPGRFERVDCGQPFTVVVDYAHTHDALRNLTTLARQFIANAGSRGRVITLFGCGGNRDRGKRPLMGEAAGKVSDFVVLTSDNPRGEDPQSIIADVLPGLERTGTQFAVEADRGKAIAMALKEAQPGDIVLLAGKGHEKEQVLKDGPVPFDDREVAAEALRAAGYDGCAEAQGQSSVSGARQ